MVQFVICFVCYCFFSTKLKQLDMIEVYCSVCSKSNDLVVFVFTLQPRCIQFVASAKTFYIVTLYYILFEDLFSV